MGHPATARKSAGPGLGEVIVEAPRFIDRERIFVNPPTIHIGSGSSQLKEIRFINHTGKKILVWLPNGHHYLDKKPEYLAKPILIEADKAVPLPVKPSPESGHYPYHIYCERIEDCAEGHSEPHVSCP